MLPALTVTPIGVIRTPYVDRMSAPRQAAAAAGVRGVIELCPGRDLEHAVSDLEGWDYIWVIFWFHQNSGWRPKVLPPRSAGKRRGVLSTRSPHRPNPIGLSVVKLDAVRGLTLDVTNVDMLDGTPVLDIKPYVPYADAYPDARTGWLEPLVGAKDPEPGFEVAWSDRAREQSEWLGPDRAELVARIESTLALGPQPHPYRRIKPDGEGMLLAVKDWRVRFRVDGRRVVVDAIATGYRERQLEFPGDPSLDVHRAFVARFGR